MSLGTGVLKFVKVENVGVFSGEELGVVDWRGLACDLGINNPFDVIVFSSLLDVLIQGELNDIPMLKLLSAFSSNNFFKGLSPFLPY